MGLPLTKKLYIKDMDDPRYILEIDALLRKMAELERAMNLANTEQERQYFSRCLRNREKRLDHLTPFRFKLYLRNVCKEVGVIGNFLER